MIMKLVNAWDKNKANLKDYFKFHEKENFDSYKKILKLMLELVINPYLDEENYNDMYSFNVNNITEIDDGVVGIGTLLYIVPYDVYQPSPDAYIMTYVSYGSCSGCDTLMGILSSGDSPLPNDNQIKDLMTLALHMLQHMTFLISQEEYSENWRRENL